MAAKKTNKGENNNYLWIGMVILLIIFLWWMSRNKAQAQPNPNPQQLPEGGGGSTANGGTIPTILPKQLDKSMMLYKGVTAPEVAELQKHLNSKRGNHLTVDGVFGPKTEDSLLIAYGVKKTSLNTIEALNFWS